ncbi:immunity protein YezG family protein [Shouchella hunanensis]|uniref:DUF600 family protein n=1 Tax=Shouchella hunanensis TaxID=766894 RepID=A0ABY7W242_9BACI|nr:immunity protein YezG family protein [Shouchella hunanensis]WDF02116.1 DUF600 family protein [Shouchella hunanensis]
MNEEEYSRLWNNLLDTMQELKKAFVANKQEPRTNFTMLVDNTGKINIDSSYEDLSNRDPHVKARPFTTIASSSNGCFS